MENIGLALTNIFLALSCLLYAKYSWQVATPIPLLKNNITWLYLSIFLCCTLNFLIFGFYNLPDGEIHNFIEQTALLSTTFIIYFVLSIVLTPKMPSKPRKVRALLLIPCGIYAALTFQWSNFTYSNFVLLPVIGWLGYSMLQMYLLNRNKQLFFGILSLSLLTLLICFQHFLINFHNLFFFMLYIPVVLIASVGVYQGLALYLNQSTKSGLFNVIANNRLNGLTATSFYQIKFPKTVEETQEYFKQAKVNSKNISVQSTGYSIGGQHLVENGILMNTKKMNKVEFFDSVNGMIKVGPAMSWHQLLCFLTKSQKDNPSAWMPKQIPSQFLDYSIGGAASSNAHGNNLFSTPFISDIESIDLVDFSGEMKRVHRKANHELFQLAIGGYGLFGIITGVELKLARKTILKRSVIAMPVKDLANEITKHAQAGCLNFEMLLNTDETSGDFLQTGITSSYLPIEADPKTVQFEPYRTSYFDKQMYKENMSLFLNAKKDKLTLQNEYLLQKNELYYWSNQIVPYCPVEKNIGTANLFFPEYRDHHLIEQQYFIPLSQISSFLNKISMHKICREFNLMQAKITVTKKDEESFLHWSNQDYIAIELSFYIPKTAQSVIKIQEYLKELTEFAIQHEGSFDLGYTQSYEKDHVLKSYPLMTDFLNLKLKHDPSEIIQSTWYQSIKKLVLGHKMDSHQAFLPTSREAQLRK